MWLTLLLLIFLVLIVFGFVLEPIVRAQKDKVVIETLKLPQLPPGLIEEIDSDSNSDTNNTETATASCRSEQQT